MRTAFTRTLGGRRYRFAAPSAWGQLSIPSRASRMLPALFRLGIPEKEALALASNAVLLHLVLRGDARTYSPMGVLRRFGLSQIAELAKLYYSYQDESAAAAQDGFTEGGVNASFPGGYEQEAEKCII